jgi:ribosomal protein S18 acetylase RimI-like enzyme
MKPRGEPLGFKTRDGRAVIIRRLSRRDLRAVLEFANDLVRERDRNPDLGIISLDRRMSVEDERKFLERMIRGVAKKEEVSLAAFSGRRMVAHCHVSRRTPKDVRHTGVFGLTISSDYRGIGIGRKLSTEVLNEALQIGVWLVELTVFAINEKAISLYERIGFKRVGIIPNKILRDGRHLDEIIMYADLRGSDKSPLRARGRS